MLLITSNLIFYTRYQPELKKENYNSDLEYEYAINDLKSQESALETDIINAYTRWETLEAKNN